MIEFYSNMPEQQSLLPSAIHSFLDALLARSGDYRERACLTLTAIHPDGQHRTPSRHVLLHRPDLLDEAMARLLATNRLGWGARLNKCQ